MDERRYITVKEAISLLPKGDTVHTYRQEKIMLIEANLDRADIIQKITEADSIELTGERARSLDHGMAIYNLGRKSRTEALFIQTDMDKLEKFDPEPPKESEE